MFIIFFFFQHSNSRTNLYADSCTLADSRNCQQFFNCFGFLESCNAQERYNTKTYSCQNYFLTDCEERPNPPFPTPQESCLAFNEGLTEINRFPTSHCNQFISCSAASYSLNNCGNQFYSIPDFQCRPIQDVICGLRD